MKLFRPPGCPNDKKTFPPPPRAKHAFLPPKLWMLMTDERVTERGLSWKCSTSKKWFLDPIFTWKQNSVTSNFIHCSNFWHYFCTPSITVSHCYPILSQQLLFFSAKLPRPFRTVTPTFPHCRLPFRSVTSFFPHSYSFTYSLLPLPFCTVTPTFPHCQSSALNNPLLLLARPSPISMPWKVAPIKKVK